MVAPMKRGAIKRDGAELAVVAAAYLAMAWLVYGGVPGAVYWHGWADQSLYVESAKAFLHGDLAARHHWYPLGYSLLLAPLAWLPMWLAFLIADLLFLLGAWRGFLGVAERFGLSAKAALAVFVLTTVLHPLIAVQWVTPWTTTLSACLIWQALARTLALAEPSESESPRHSSARGAFVLGLVLGAIPATRPVDGVIAAILALYVLARVWRRPREIAAAALGGMLVVAAFVALHLAIHGPVFTDYMKLSAAHGMNFARLGWKAYLILVEPQPWFPYGWGLLRACPWLVLGAAGLLGALGQKASRYEAALLGLVAAVYCALVLAYVDLLPSGLWYYNNVNYFKWLLPLFGLFAVLFVRSARRRPGLAAALLAIVVLPTALRFEPVPVGADAPARALLFPAVAEPVGRDQIYHAHSVIRDRAGQLRNIFEYHQIQRSDLRTRREDGRVVAVALRRDFAGGELWLGNGAVLADWPASRTGDHDRSPLPGPWPKAPEARYAPRMALGVPCWLPFYQCPTELP
jgi:hypothetical protein